MQPHQLESERALQEALAIKPNRVLVESRVHLVDRAVVRPRGRAGY